MTEGIATTGSTLNHIGAFMSKSIKALRLLTISAVREDNLDVSLTPHPP
jgi:hypothetical protein